MRNGRSLLLVDDDEVTRELLQMLLTNEGWTVKAAESGDEALRCMPETVPDVILSDLQMPGLSGTPMAAALRDAARQGKPLLIAMTATNNNGAPKGFDDLLVKPFAPADLLQRCEALWTGHAANLVQATNVADGEPVIAQGTFQRMQASMPAQQLRALYDFALQDAEGRLTRMVAASEAGDEERYCSEAHALKGSCGMVGALRLRSLEAIAEEEGFRHRTLIEWNPLLQFHEEINHIRLMLETLLPRIR